MKTVVLHVAAVQFTATRLLLPQLEALAAAGYDVRLACDPGGNGFAPVLRRYRPTAICFPRSLNLPALLGASFRLITLMRRLRPDVLHLHTPAAALPIRLLPRLIFGYRPKIVYTVHGFPHTWDLASVRDRVLQRVEQWLAGRTDLLLFQSAEDFKEASRRSYKSHLVLLGNGVQDYWFDIVPRQRKRILEVLFVGRLVKEKGILDLMQAVLNVPGVHLSIAGAALDTDRDSVEGIVRETASGSPSRFSVLGMLRSDGLRHVMARSDVLALPSYREGVPRSVIEALAAGRPVLGTDIRGTRELVTDGVNGHIVSPGDITALSAQLRALRSASAGDFAIMCTAAKASVAGRRESSVFERLLGAYRSVGIAA